MRYALVVAFVLIGIAAFVYGGYDDSPGLQLVGAVVVIGAIVFGVREIRRGR